MSLKDLQERIEDALSSMRDNPSHLTNHEIDDILFVLEEFKNSLHNPWQPIETAPIDGTEIICYDGLNYFVAAYGVESRGASLLRGEEFWEGFISQEGMQNPKHWMPLSKLNCEDN